MGGDRGTAFIVAKGFLEENGVIFFWLLLRQDGSEIIFNFWNNSCRGE